MPDYQAVYNRLTMPGSKANLFYLWLKYKRDCPCGYQYTQYCLYFKRFVGKHYGSDAVSMVVERIPGETVYIDWIGDQPEILKATMAEIRICDRNNKLICTHKRSYKDFPKYITKPEHMAPGHQYYKEANSKDGAYYRRWASSIGPYIVKLIDAVLLAPQHEEQTYNSCNGILHMCKNQSKLMLENIAKICVESNACRSSSARHILTPKT